MQIFFAFGINAQSLEVWSNGYKINQGEEINHFLNSKLDTLSMYISGVDTFYYYAYEAVFSLTAKNITSTPTSYHVKKYDLILPDSAQSFMCWDRCLSPVQNQSIDAVEIKPNSEFTGGSFHYKPRGSRQNARVAYVFFDEANPNDSLFFIINYIPSDTISSIVESSNTKLKVYPNPAIDVIYIEIDPAEIMSINIYNQSGQLVFQSTTSTNRIFLSNLKMSNGLHYINVQLTNGTSLNQKLIYRK